MSTGADHQEGTMANEGRVRISLSNGELEVEGSAEFVATYDAAIRDMLEKLVDGRTYSTPVRPGAGGPGAAAGAAAGSTSGTASESKPLGEVLNGLPNNTAGTDQILIAAWFAAGDEPFSTADANKVLVDHGIKLSNAAQAMRGNLSSKRVFRVGSNKWRIAAKPGKDHLRSLGVEL